MNILYIHNDYGRPSGEEHAAGKIAGLLTERGHRVQWFRRSSVELGDSLSGKAKAFFSGIANPASARALDRLLHRKSPDVVQVQNVFPLISPSIFRVLRKHRLPVVMRCPNYRLFCPNGRHSCHGQVCEQCLKPGREFWCVFNNCEDDALKSLGYAMRNAVARLTGSILTNVHVFIVQSRAQKVLFVRNGISPERIDILPGLVDIDDSNKAPTVLGKYITFVGRISQEKGIDEFIDAARALPQLSFAVAGDDGQMPGLRQASPGNVRWMGFLEGDQLNRFYQQSRIVVVPSRWYEGFPNVIIQAMAWGKPVICASIGGLPEIVRDGVTGSLFEPRNASQLAEKIAGLYGDPATCQTWGQAGYERVKADYSLEAGYTCLMHTYMKAIAINKRKTGRSNWIGDDIPSLTASEEGCLAVGEIKKE